MAVAVLVEPHRALDEREVGGGDGQRLGRGEPVGEWVEARQHRPAGVEERQFGEPVAVGVARDDAEDGLARDGPGHEPVRPLEEEPVGGHNVDAAVAVDVDEGGADGERPLGEPVACGREGLGCRGRGKAGEEAEEKAHASKKRHDRKPSTALLRALPPRHRVRISHQ